MEFDLKITNALIVDGSGEPGYRGDIGISSGKIAAIGQVTGSARETIDAMGQVAAPGFVDIHTHYDAQVLWDSMLSISPWHGVTTVVMGNCGFGIAPTRPEHQDYIMRTLEKVEGMSFSVLREGLGANWPFESFAEYMDAIEAGGVAVNVAVLAGHTPIRFYVMGLDSLKREATRDEIGEMEALVKGAIEAGAVGFATSQVPLHFAFDGYPVPSRLASLGEVDALVGAMAAAGGGVLEVAAGPSLYIEEMADLSRKHDVTVTWAALLADSPAFGAHHTVLAANLAEQANGAKLVPQVSCRPLQFDMNLIDPYFFGAAPFFNAPMCADDAQRRAIYADPAFRDAFRNLGRASGTLYENWHARSVVSYDPTGSAEANTPLDEAAARAGKDVVDYVLDTSLASDFVFRIRVDAVNFDEAEVAKLLDVGDTHAVIALSDAGAHSDQLCDACYSTHLLGHWVRDRKIMPLERAVRMLTSRPAEVYGLEGRGRLRVGDAADIVLFDPDTVGASPLQRVADLPSHGERLVSYARGISAVIVNGTILREGAHDRLGEGDALPGQVLRRRVLVSELR